METPQQNTQASKYLLLLSCVHGDEHFSHGPINQLQKQFEGRFDWVIGNPPAFEQKVRFVQKNLNRIAPGDPQSDCYEDRRAYEILQIAKPYNFVVDIHGTLANCGVTAIVSNPVLENIAFASAMDVDSVVFWADKAERATGKGPLAAFMKKAVVIECGPENQPAIAERLYNVLLPLVRDGVAACLANAQPKPTYAVYGSVSRAMADANGICPKDFEEVTMGDEKFYPYLSMQYPGYACHKLRKINWYDSFAYDQGRENLL